MDAYIKIPCARLTEFFVNKHPDDIFEEISTILQGQENNEGYTLNVDSETYKAKIENESNGVSIKVKLLKVSDNVYAVDFTCQEGDLVNMMNIYN
jgi:hypothetical protein